MPCPLRLGDSAADSSRPQTPAVGMAGLAGGGDNTPDLIYLLHDWPASPAEAEELLKLSSASSDVTFLDGVLQLVIGRTNSALFRVFLGSKILRHDRSHVGVLMTFRCGELANQEHLGCLRKANQARARLVQAPFMCSLYLLHLTPMPQRQRLRPRPIPKLPAVIRSRWLVTCEHSSKRRR